MKLLKLILKTYIDVWETLYDDFYHYNDKWGFYLLGSVLLFVTALLIFLLGAFVYDYTIQFIVIYFILSHLYNKISEEGLEKHKPKYDKFKEWLDK